MSFNIGIFITIISALITYNLLHFDEKDSLEGSLFNKNVIITGASSGIGKEAAIYASKLGANLILIARRESLLIDTINACKKVSSNPSSKFFHIVFDFNHIESIEELIMKSATLFANQIDYLILNHAFLLSNKKDISVWNGSSHQMHLLDYSMRVNFVSLVAATNIAMPYLEKSGGCLLAVSSMIVEHAAYSLPYGASKGAINVFFTGLRQELLERQSNMSVVIMHFGLIQTEKAKESVKSMSKTSKMDIERILSAFEETSSVKGGTQMIRSAISRHPPYVYFPFDQKLNYLKALRALVSDPEYVDQMMSNFIIFIINFKEKIFECLKL